jgi:Ca2+-binding RTX toxin-like protein
MSADIGQIGILGLALTQVVSMANYVMRLRTPRGDPVTQIKVEARTVEPSPSERYVTALGNSAAVPFVHFVFSDTVSSTGLDALRPGDVVKLTGHSLGGHLAYMAARLFPDVFDQNVVVFNAAGYDPDTANTLQFLDQINQISPLPVPDPLSLMGNMAKRRIADEMGSAANSLAIHGNQLTNLSLNAIRKQLFGPGAFTQGTPNVTSIRSEDLLPEDDRSIVPSELTGAEKYGPWIDLPTEHNNHTIEPLADALALQALIEPMQGTAFTRDELIRVLNAGSNDRARSYEEIAEALYRLALGGEKFLTEGGQREGEKLPTSNEFSVLSVGKGLIGQRNAFHDAVLRTQDALKGHPGLSVRSLADLSSSSLANLAVHGDADAVAYRYALRALDPLVVVGSPIIYEPHDTSGRLELHDLVNGGGTISDVWIQDRSTFLFWKNTRNTNDIPEGVSVRRRDNGTLSYVLTDRAIRNLQGQELTFSVVAIPFRQNDLINMVFGVDQTSYSEELFGTAHVDHLFGEGGDDLLIGGLGNDYLEGGPGNDTYAYFTGHGDDTILDVDDTGIIAFDGVALATGERIGPYQWRFTSDFGREFFYWLRNERDGSRSVTITAANTPGSVTIRGYRDGALGIALPDFVPDAPPAGEVEAGTEGNDVLRHPFQPVKLGLAGDDVVYGHADFWLEGGLGNDWLPYEYSSGEPARGFTAFGGPGDDFAHGSAYDDALHAEDVAQFDALVDGTGSAEPGPEREVLFGAAGNDVLAGGRGNDWIAGGIGADVLYGGAGDDVLSGAGEIFMGDEIGQAALDPQAQTFFNVHTSGRFDQTHPSILINLPLRLSDYGFTAEVLGSVAREGLDGSGWRDGADLIFAGAGDDEAWGGYGDDLIAGEEGNDLLFGESRNDFLDGGAGDDHLAGGEGDDVLIGGPGADLLEGGAGDDTYMVDASDVVRDYGGRNRIRFAADARREALRAIQSGTTLILTGVAGGTLTIENGLAGAIAEVEIEYSSFSFGEFLSSIAADDLVVQGGDGDEALFGASGNDRISTGRGSDTIAGSAGNDVYLFTLGDGFDVLTDLDGVNAVEFGPGIDAAAVTANVFFNFSTGGYDMHVGYGPGDTVAIFGGHTGPIVEYRLSDGSVLSHAEMVARDTQGFRLAGTEENDSLLGGGGNDLLEADTGDDTLLAGPGNDTLRGGQGNDLLVGGADADRLEGGDGSDTYFFESSAGTDILDDVAGANTIRFGAGIAPESIASSILNATDGGIYLSLQYGASDYLLVKQDPARPGASAAIFAFADGEPLTQGELMARTLATPLDYIAGSGAILLYGSRFNDTVLGSEQSDFVDGGDGDDLLQGEGGSDVLVGGDGDDVLLGGAGDDALAGGAGSDTYALRRGMGRDTIAETPGDADVNTLRLSSDLSLADLAWSRQGSNLYLHVSNTRDGAVITNYFADEGFASAWQVESTDGTITPLADVLAGLEPTPRAASVATAYERFEERVRAAYASGLYSAGWTLGADGRFHREETFNGTFFSSHGVSDLGFSVASQADDAPFLERQSEPLLRSGQTFSQSLATQTVQVLNTSNSRVVPVADGGNAYRPGAQPPLIVDVNEVLQFGAGGILLPENVVPIYDGRVVTRVQSADPAPQPRVAALATYSGGATPVYTTQTITHVHHEATSSWEVQIADITGGDAANAIDGGRGFSMVDGGAGNDVLRAEGSIFLPNAPLAGDSLPGALLYGNAGDDLLQGTGFDDVLIGGSGNDEMRGGSGNDLYLVFPGDGDDLIVDDGETVAGIVRENVLELPEGVTLGELGVSYGERVVASRYRLPTNNGITGLSLLSVHSTLLLSWDAASVRIVLPHTEQIAGTGIDLVRFSDGSSATLTEIFALTGGAPDMDPHNRDNSEAAITYGGGGDDTLQGSMVIGGQGRDTLSGTASDDHLYGAELVEEGYANLTGGASFLSTLWDDGNDYRGGPGNDVVFATAGSDAFHYDLGDGFDTVTDMLHDETFLYYGGPIGSTQHFLPHWQDPTALQADHLASLFSSGDTLRFGPGIAPDAVRFYRRGFYQLDDLLIMVGGAGVRMENWFNAQINQLARIEFADGTVWDRAGVLTRAGSAPSLVIGSEFDDDLFGGPENEVFEGGGGNDTYFIDAGGGSDAIVDSGGYDTLNLGVDPDQVTLGLGSLRIRIGAGRDEVHLANFDPDDALAGSDIELFRFADGTELAYADLVSRGFDLFGSAGEDTIRGTNVVDRIDGGAGNDTLAGGLGSDTYRFGTGSGLDLIREAASATDIDTLEILVKPGEVTVTREADNIVVSLEGSADRVAIEWFSDPYARIENVTFADGTSWDAPTLEAQIRTDANRAPALSSPLADQSILEDIPVTYVLPADAFSDPDSDALSYGVGVLPAWLSFDPDTRTLSGTPRNADVGSHPVTVIATDPGGLSASDELVLAVLNVNDAPVVAQPLSNRVFDAGSPFVFSVPAQTFVDEDAADSLVLSASLVGGSPLPAWLAFDTASATFAGSPKAKQLGISRIALTATDAAGASAVADFELIIRTAADATASGTQGDDFLYGNSGDETLKAKRGNDYLYGDAGDDVLRGGSGNDILRGGAGNDVLYLGKGNDLIVFSRGDGIDTVYGGRDGGDTLSLGGGIDYDDLSLSRHGKDLVLNVGTADKIVLKNWYAGMKSVENLQLVTDAGVETFDFLGLAGSFDAARKGSPGVSSWALTNALLQWHLEHSEDAALGGDLAYWYARSRGLGEINVQAAQNMIGAPGFGSDAHSLRLFEGLREGFAKLA